MALFVAGAFGMGVLLLGFCVCFVILMARVNGETAKVLTEALEKVFWPKGQAQPNVEADPEHSVSQAMDEKEDDWPLPAWETEDMSPYAPTSAGPSGSGILDDG